MILTLKIVTETYTILSEHHCMQAANNNDYHYKNLILIKGEVDKPSVVQL